MKLYKLGLICCLICSWIVFAKAQTGDGAISGMVLDQENRRPLQGVNITIKDTRLGTATDSDGRFVISRLSPGTYSLGIYYVGYAEKHLDNITVSPGETTTVDVIVLVEEPIMLSEIVFTPGQFSIMGSQPGSQLTLSNEDMKNISFAEDITRAVSRLPGVSSNDFSSKFTVRGGEADEVLIQLDGMELYEPFHQRDFAGGLFSIVDIETIEGVDLLTGGFSAEYGDRQSGVFNMKSKTIRDDQQHTSLGLSLVNIRLYTDGNFAKNRGKYLFSARRGLLDQIAKLADQTENVPVFYDVTGKVEYQLSPKQVLSFHALHAGDETKVRDIAETAHDIHDTRYTNSYGWFTLTSFFNPRLYARTLLYSGYITHDRNGDTDKPVELSDKLNFMLKDKRSYYLYGLKQDWMWDVADRISLKSGFDVKQLNADYDYSYSLRDARVDSNEVLRYYSNSVDIQQKPSGQQARAYISGRFKLLSKLFMESGLRYDYTSYTKDNLFSPRLGLAYAFSKNTFLRGAWGYYYQTQFINNLDVNHNATTFNPAELSKHYVLGLEHQFYNGIHLRLDGYYKDISRISPSYQNLRDPWEVYPESRNDVIRLEFDGATARGIELYMKYDQGKKISWWFSYSLAEALENITRIEFNGLLDSRTGELPRINNQLHTLYVDLNYRPNRRWYFNLSWQYYKGWPLTTYYFKPDSLDNGLLHFYPVHNTFRGEEYPPYHRMDLRINRHFYAGRGRISAFLHIINLYNRQNLKKFDVDVTDGNGNLVPDGQGGYQYFRDDKNWLGLLPVLGISWEF